jgi:hypothetical protein
MSICAGGLQRHFVAGVAQAAAAGDAALLRERLAAVTQTWRAAVAGDFGQDVVDGLPLAPVG